MSEIAALDCLSCGACCQTAGEVTVDGEDITPRRLTRSVRGVMGFASYEADYLRRMARREDGACIALRGIIGANCACSIYGKRPAVCRDFVAGKPACLRARSLALSQPHQSEGTSDA